MASCESEMTESEIALLLAELESTKNIVNILEIGTAAGGTLVHVLKSLPGVGRPKVVVIDTFDYFTDHLSVFKKNLSDNGFDPESIDARAVRSNIALKDSLRRQETFSFIIVDGSHKMKHVTQDLRWLSLLSVGGKAALHDYSDNLPGVKLAVDTFLRQNGNYKLKSKADTLMVLEKTAATSRAEVTVLNILFAFAYSIVLQNKKSINKFKAIFRL